MSKFKIMRKTRTMNVSMSSLLLQLPKNCFVISIHAFISESWVIKTYQKSKCFFIKSPFEEFKGRTTADQSLDGVFVKLTSTIIFLST